ncbi:MAG TPA: hypothetical protein VG455_16170 [Acidimicrobiales bacterium]|nr:hypothetical protein [Acidimicrobiales bacterium]
MDEGLIPEPIRSDIEAGVAAALDEPYLRATLESFGVPGVSDDQKDVDLIVMLVPRTHGGSWPPPWKGRDTFFPYLAGYIVATIQALDLAAARDQRPLKSHQQEWLTSWENQSGYESR